MKPRITVETRNVEAGHCSVFLYANETGLKLLIDELYDLSKTNDHFHLGSPEWTGIEEDPLSLKPYDKQDSAATAGHLKVLFRPDDWDKEYYPHLFSNLGS